MDTSVFTDQTRVPSPKDLSASLGSSINFWMEIKKFVFTKYTGAAEEWNYPGAKYGWSFRIKDKKRVIIYLLPRDKYFLAAFVFGQKATDFILGSNIFNDIKLELQNARVYAEGRGIRIEVKSEKILPDIKKLIEIKLAN